MTKKHKHHSLVVREAGTSLTIHPSPELGNQIFDAARKKLSEYDTNKVVEQVKNRFELLRTLNRNKTELELKIARIQLEISLLNDGKFTLTPSGFLAFSDADLGELAKIKDLY